MKNIKEYLSNNQKIVRGPVNKINMDEEFNPIEENNETIGYHIMYTKKNKACIVGTILIGNNQYKNLYRITEVIYPEKITKKLDMSIQVNDIFSEMKFYNVFKILEKAKREYDKFYQHINEYKFYPLPELTMAKNWYQDLSKEEQKYIQILFKNNAF